VGEDRREDGDESDVVAEKIEPRPGHPIYVLTVPGVGYRIKSDVAEKRE